MVKNLPFESKEMLKNDFIRLAEEPTEGEKLEEIDVKAKEIINQL